MSQRVYKGCVGARRTFTQTTRSRNLYKVVHPIGTRVKQMPNNNEKIIFIVHTHFDCRYCSEPVCKLCVPDDRYKTFAEYPRVVK
jgi:hypothetical protein